MIKTHSDDPNVEQAAAQALDIISSTLENLPQAAVFDYGGHTLEVGQYGVCERCTASIAEAQAVEAALRDQADRIMDATVKEHIDLAAQYFHAEAEAAIIRAEFHNGHGTEKILDTLLGFRYHRKIDDDYTHTHQGNDA